MLALQFIVTQAVGFVVLTVAWVVFVMAMSWDDSLQWVLTTVGLVGIGLPVASRWLWKTGSVWTIVASVVANGVIVAVALLWLALLAFGIGEGP